MHMFLTKKRGKCFILMYKIINDSISSALHLERQYYIGEELFSCGGENMNKNQEADWDSQNPTPPCPIVESANFAPSSALLLPSG
ncbi:hypothetical protein CFP56_009498 [Quercus suber]|uniref:Uncharacterized protein n=1 Tax=Quercus suber TaxID=58331 RepID=A0AAW0M513_QUESU